MQRIKAKENKSPRMQVLKKEMIFILNQLQNRQDRILLERLHQLIYHLQIREEQHRLAHPMNFLFVVQRIIKYSCCRIFISLVKLYSLIVW